MTKQKVPHVFIQCCVFVINCWTPPVSLHTHTHIKSERVYEWYGGAGSNKSDGRQKYIKDVLETTNAERAKREQILCNVVSRQRERELN